MSEDRKNSVRNHFMSSSIRDSIGDYAGAFNYIERIKEIDPRNSFVNDNYESYKDRAENGGSFMSFFKNIFGKRMG